MSSEGMQKPGEEIKAKIDKESVSRLVELRYGLVVKNIVELDAYDDRNYRIVCENRMPFGNPHISAVSKHGYVVKIINSLTSQSTGLVDAQNELLCFLTRKGFRCPCPVKQKDGSYYSVEKLGDSGEEKRHVLRVLVFLPGEVFDKVPTTPDLLKQVGHTLARLDKTLEEFSHPAYENRTYLWSLMSVPQLREFFFAVEDDSERALAEEVVSAFEQRVLTVVNTLDQGMIHGDLNENNMIVSPDGKSLEAIIDFGDSMKDYYVFELAICLCYMITQSRSVGMAKHVIEGYQEVRRLPQKEKEVLKVSVCARLVQSLVLGSYSYQKEPENDYLIRQHAVKWRLLKELWPISDAEIASVWEIN